MKLQLIIILCGLCFGSLNAESGGKHINPLRLTLTYDGLPDPNYLLATFKNESTSNIRILKPVGGSEWPQFSRAGIEPVYEMSIRDGSGVALPIKGHCKIFGPFLNTHWPDDYLVMLSPGESISVKVYIAANVPEDGEYVVQLKYWFTGEANYPLPAMKEGLSTKAIWKGEVKSAPTQLKIKKTTFTDLGTRAVGQGRADQSATAPQLKPK